MCYETLLDIRPRYRTRRRDISAMPKVLAISIILLALWSPAEAVQFAPPPGPTPLQGFGYGFQSGMAANGCATAPDPAMYGAQQWAPPAGSRGFTCYSNGPFTNCY